MEEKQQALWEQVQKEGKKMLKEFSSFHCFEYRYMLHDREVAVLFEFGSPEGPIDCYYVDESFDIRDFFLLQKDKE